MATAFVLTGCQNGEPFDTQSPDDAPLILKPYNESGTGSFTYNLANPDTPLFDSVTVTPSRYTTVNWYLDGNLIFTGTKINMCFPAGKYALVIEAVTEKGLRTERKGSVTVHPYDTDPYSAAPAGGRHLVPGIEMSLNGQNLSKVTKIILTSDFYGENEVCSVEPSYKDDATLKFTLPALADGRYYVRFIDAEGNVYGAEVAEIHNGSVALSGFSEFVPGETWTITGVNLQNVASLTVDDQTITELTVTETSVTLTAPAAAIGQHTLSMKNQDGSDVLFVTEEGTVAQAKTVVSEEKTIWTGPHYIQWSENLVRIESTDMAQVPAGSTIVIYYDKLPAGHEAYYEGAEYKEYQKMQIITAWWTELVAGFDVNDDTPNPYSFTYTAAMKELVDAQNAMSVVGWGLNINKITYK